MWSRREQLDRALAPVQPALAQESVSSIWPPTLVSTVKADTDTSAVQAGVEFVAAINGWLAAIAFDNFAASRGRHVGRLCDAHRQSVSNDRWKGRQNEANS